MYTKKLNFGLSDTEPRVSQYFYSIEGEGFAIGAPSLFIRLAGCYSAACQFCDTKFSWGNSEKYPLVLSEEFKNKIKEVLGHGSDDQECIGSKDLERITITGGEPLHYIKWFSKIAKQVKELDPQLKFIGFETNGNLLANLDHARILQEELLACTRLGISPTITISPKIDAKTCYLGELTQEEVDSMYEEAFKNIWTTLGKYNFVFKFVYGISDEEDKMVNKYINKLLNIGFKKHNIRLMPFTPEDPLGEDADTWLSSKNYACNSALELGVYYSPRLHIDRQLD